MKFGTITRGDQKIYVHLTAQCPEGGSVVAQSSTNDGRPLPALVAEKDRARGEYVLIVPLLHVDQTVTVRALTPEGLVAQEISQKIGHLASALTAKYNTLSKAPGVEDIRNYDKFVRPDVSRVERRYEMRSTLEPDHDDIVQVIITAQCADAHSKTAPYTIEVFDQQGKIVPISNCVTLGDKVDHPVSHSDLARRTIDVSFRKPGNDDWFFVWVRFEDDALPAGFVCMDDWRIGRARECFENRVRDTGQGPFYEDWFYYTQKRSPMELEAQRAVRFDIEPTFSIIVPLYQTPIDFFHEMASSVLGQTYGKFELILVNSTPEDEALSAAVAALEQSDERVRVITLEGNRGIVGNTNEGIRAATGDFLSFFDHDDILEPDILFEYVDAINRYPETDLLYCDEDKIKDGKLFDGFLKSDFSWDLLTSCNYICHLLTVRKSVVDTVELSTDDVNGAQDWDLTMKVAEKARNVFHVRRVLYHWRCHEKSVASGTTSKLYTHKAGEIALKGHFDRIGVPVRIGDGHVENMHSIEYVLPEEEELVSMLIPSKDHADMLEHFLESIFDKTTYSNYEIIVIENNSTDDETFAFYDRIQAEHDNVRVVFYEGGFNYSAICNFGVRHAKGSYLLFLNNDMEAITPNWVELLLGPLQREDVGATGARLLFPDDTIQHAGVIIPKAGPAHVAREIPNSIPFYFGMVRNARDVLAVTGACLMVRRDDFDAVGGFDEEFVVEYNDVDLCLRLRERGKHVIVNPAAQLYHFESVSRGYNESLESKTRHVRELAMFQQRWPRYVAEGDPFYGTNIACNSDSYMLDWVPRS